MPGSQGERCSPATASRTSPSHVSLPGRGSGLVAGLRTAQLTRAEIQAVLLDGFFPECDAQAHPYRTQAALKEWGLPYASDSAVTRHLADFLRGRPRVDAILFNGGSLHPELAAPKDLSAGREMAGGLATAGAGKCGPRPRCCARRGTIRKIHSSQSGTHRGGRRPRGFSRSTQRAAARRLLNRLGPRLYVFSLVGHPPSNGSTSRGFRSRYARIALRASRPITPLATTEAKQATSSIGVSEEFHALPPLETIIKVTDPAPGITADTLPVTLIASANELGLLQVSCVSADHRIRQSWPLEFNLRPHEQDSQNALQSGAVSSASAQPSRMSPRRHSKPPGARIRSWFTRSPKQREALTAARLLRNLEQILGMPKSEWNAALVRALWPALESCMARRKESADHEEAWLILAGFLLRPGFGAAADNFRIDSLWRLREQGLKFPGKRSKAQEYLLWRRVAGGLSEQRQEQILAPELDKIRTQKNLAPELIRLAGSLERLPIETKTELANLFIDTAASSPARTSTVLPILARWATFSAGHHFMPDQRQSSRPILWSELTRPFVSLIGQRQN